MPKKLGFLGFGILFGFALSRVGASDYDLIVGMFTGEDFKLVGVILTAILVGWIGLRLLHIGPAKTRSGESLSISHKKMGRWTLLGALLFGIGWGMAGACPGTVLTQVGEGKLFGLFTFAGMISGTYLYARLKEKHPKL